MPSRSSGVVSLGLTGSIKEETGQKITVAELQDDMSACLSEASSTRELAKDPAGNDEIVETVIPGSESA